MTARERGCPAVGSADIMDGCGGGARGGYSPEPSDLRECGAWEDEEEEGPMAIGGGGAATWMGGSIAWAEVSTWAKAGEACVGAVP